MHRALDEIRREGLEALKDRLGQADMIRFLQQFESGKGNYSLERHNWVDRTTMDDIRKALKKPKKTAQRNNTRKSK
ncbi:MAG: hypothetical protein FLDDKLPJ_00962 [Phycisphaerae bacterium]|nr:hypothetical protein [Phycisphaerae bacterium]